MTPPPISAEQLREIAAKAAILGGLTYSATQLRALADWLEAQENSAEIPQNTKGE